MVALLTGAVMFALGLFFGWLLHRERVERALYEDAVRSRDRAAAALSETTAQLELANKDLVRLRGRLKDAQHLLDAREAAIVQLERQVVGHLDAAAAANGSDGVRAATAGQRASQRVSPGAGEEVAAASVPAGGRLFDQLDLDDEVDITDEVAVSSTVQAAVPAPTAEAARPPPEQEDAHPVPDGSPADAPGASAAVAALAPAGTEVPEGVDPLARAEVSKRVDPPAGSEASERVDPAAGSEVSKRVDPPAAMNPSADAAPAAEADDLRRINGIGPALERALHEQGITTFRQLALLDDAAIDELKSGAPRVVTRLRRGNWVAQARRLHIDTHGDEP